MANRCRFPKFAAAAGVAVLMGLLSPVSTTDALAGGAQRTARVAKAGWRAVPFQMRRAEPPFVLIVGISY